MGSRRWRLANRKKQAGQLDSVGRFLPAASGLAACSAAVPITMDAKAAVAAAGGLASAGIRSFELWWDGAEKRLQFVLAGEAQDLPNFRQSFRNMYPNAEFSDMDSVVPSWFDPDAGYRVFDVGTYHGHYTAVFDQARAHQLITQISNSIQLSKYAWIQFTFRHYNFGAFLRRHVARLDERAREIRGGKYLSNSEIIMHPDRRPHDHPEMGYDFTNNYSGLQKHATLKTQGSHLLMSIRGLMQSDAEMSLHFDEIEALPLENIRSGHEHLTKFRYGYGRFWPDGKATRARVRGAPGARPRLRLFESRLLPDPAPFLDSAMSRYFDRAWIGGYRERPPLPFLILNLSEIPLFVHLPDPLTPNIEATRGVVIPAKPSEKAGSSLGPFRAAKGPDRAPEWGLVAKSKEAGAAVISPADLATHIYAVGASGSGKTSLIRVLAKHLEAWSASGTLPNAFVYVDPKGDDSHKFVRQCGEGPLDAGMVHFLDPQQTRFSINPLELPPHDPSEREEVVSRYVGYFMKTIEEWYQQAASFVQMERIFRALLFYVYMRHDAPTFLDIHDIILRLQGSGKSALPKIIETFGKPDPEMRQALESIATLKGDAFTPLLNRVEQFATDPVLKRMFSVRHGTVDFADLIKPGRQTIVRISPLNMPHHVQPLAMQAFILKLWFTIQERANRVTDEKERTQVVLALDEFQIVKDLQVLQLMLEQARSLGLGLVLSHQTAEQISDRQLGLITGNSGTQLVGKVNGKDASRIAQIWDPQFQRELQQQLASQEYFHWTVREKAPPGEEQPPPIQFWLRPPPELLAGKERYERFLAGQLARYGRGVVEDTIVRQSAADRAKWLESISVRFPSRLEWGIMLLLREGPMRQVDMAVRLRVANRSEVLEALTAMIGHGTVKKSDPGSRASAYELTKRAERDYFGHDLGSIGTADDVEGVAARAIRGYLKMGMFVAVASQKVAKGQDRTDLVAYDYVNRTPISVEIESVSEVNSHPEHVRYNMVKWRKMGFERCHVISKSPRIREIYAGLDEGEKRGVKTAVL